MPRPSFTLSSESARLYDYFIRVLKDGDEISYADLTTALGFQIDGGTPALQYAKRKALNDGVVIEVIRGIGVRRLLDNEKLNASVSNIRAIRRKSRQGTKKLQAIADPSRLTNSQQLDLTIKHAVFAIAADAASNSGQSRIQKVAEASPMLSVLPVSHIAAGLMAMARSRSKPTTP